MDSSKIPFPSYSFRSLGNHVSSTENIYHPVIQNSFLCDHYDAIQNYDHYGGYSFSSKDCSRREDIQI